MRLTAKREKPQLIDFYDQNQALRTGQLIEMTEKGAKIKYQDKTIIVPTERLKDYPELQKEGKLENFLRENGIYAMATGPNEIPFLLHIRNDE